MTYAVVNDRLVGFGVKHVSTKKTSGKMVPKMLVLHYTAGTSFEGDLAILSTASAKVSCHLVIGPNGEVGQVGDFKDALWHAGVSNWKGYSGLNQHSIGIEVTSPGWLTSKGSGTAATWSGKIIKDNDPWPFIHARHKNPKENATLWAGFTEKQIDAVLEIGALLMDHYGLKEAVGHDQIAPLRKIDPGPCCPQSVFARFNGNAEDEQEIERPDLPGGTAMKVTGVAPEKLAFRSSPNGTKRGELSENQIVEQIAVDGKWTNVRTPAGYVGWVWSSYLQAA